MAVAGSLTYDTKLDKNGFEKGLKNLENSVKTSTSGIKNIVTALGIDKIVSSAFNIISNSVDGAISRLDTLNNYPKVMSNLGIASDDAQKSINKMSDKLSGLPTTLDAGVQAVQRFTSANKDVNKSTDYFLAFNNALLAGGASADIQANALEQLSQMYAVGTVDAQAWRSVLTAMPAQLQQVATYMGYTSTAVGGDLYNALQKGQVSMEDLMQAMVTLNTEGANGFQTFEQQARNSTSGIETSITVAKTQVVKGVADIIKSFDQFLKDEGLGGIGNVISEIGKKAKEVLDTVAEKLPNVLNWIKDIIPYVEAVGIAFASLKAGIALQNIIQGFQKAKVALALYSMETKGASIAQGAFNGSLTLGQTIVGLLTGKVKLAELATAGLSKAQAVLNAIMSANPVALVVLAIGALIAIFVVLWNKSETFRNFWINLWDNIKKIVSSAIDNIKKTLNKIISFVKSNWKGLLLLFVNPFAGAFKLLYDNCEGFRNFINNFIENVKSFFVDGWNSIVSFFTETIPQWIQTVTIWIQQLPYNIGQIIGRIIGHIMNFGASIWNWITVDLPQIIQGIVEWFAQLPGRIWECLLNIINSVIEWGTNVYNTATEWISNTINSIVDWFVRLPGRIWTCLTNVINTVISWGRNLASRGLEAARNLFNNIVNTITSLPGQMLSLGENIVRGIWDGMGNLKNWIVEKVKELARGILDGMKSALGIHSPSKLFKDEVGRFIPQGVAVGIEADTDSALKAIDNMNDDIISEMNKAVAYETGSINAKASVKSNNSMLNVIQASISLDGSVEIEGQKAGKILTPYITKTLRTGGAT